jgi:hypothetical protein
VLNRIGDRLLRALVPKARASARVCWYQRCGGPCLSRHCCAIGGDTQYADCGPCRYRC